MSTSAIPVCLVRTLSPYIEFLYESGAPVDRWLEQTRLPMFLLEDLDTHIPTLNTWRFISLAEKKEGIGDLALRVAQTRFFQMISPHVFVGVCSAPTLLCGINELARRIRGDYSGLGVSVSPAEDDTVEFGLKKSFELRTPGFAQTEWMGIELLIKVVQLFAGPAWQPTTISLQAVRDPTNLSQELFPNALFLTKQPRSFISLPKELLSRSPCAFATTVMSKFDSVTAFSAPELPPASLGGSLQSILTSYLRESYPSLDLISEIVQMSSRTLQRRLHEEGVSYKEIVDRARFTVASKLLTKTDASSLEIAIEVGYEDSSHFARAFRRIAACSPREYRRRQATTGTDPH
jgi:AraC-like DNA-binding protein